MSLSSRIAGLLRNAASAMPALVRDAVGLGGFGSIVYGAWLVYPPAGYIIAGLFLLISAWFLSAKA